MKNYFSFRNTPGSVAVPQNRDAYERVLAHHGQWFRWVRAFLCPCLDEISAQPDPQCTICGGRGFIYHNPFHIKINQEYPKHDNLGRVFLEWSVWQNDLTSLSIHDKMGNVIALSGTQPSDHSYIQLASWPLPYEPITVDYEAGLLRSVTNEACEVVSSVSKILRTLAPRIYTEGKTVSGAVETVTRVYNATKLETYTVVSINKDFIYLQAMGTWTQGDVLQVDYTYVFPVNLVMYGVSQKMKWEKAYVGQDASAMMVSPYYIRPGRDDIFTALSQEQVEEEIIDPTKTAGNDVLSRFFDVASIEEIIRADGHQYDPVADVSLFGRNEIKWNTAKPTLKYMARFHYHPTYRGLQNPSSIRFAENKSFAIRTSMVMFDKVSPMEKPDLAHQY
jgi:hypothetical protein